MMVSLRRHGPGALPVRSTLGTLGEGDIGLENPIRLRHLADDPGLGPPANEAPCRGRSPPRRTHECLALPRVTAAGGERIRDERQATYHAADLSRTVGRKVTSPWRWCSSGCLGSGS